MPKELFPTLLGDFTGESEMRSSLGIGSLGGALRHSRNSLRKNSGRRERFFKSDIFGIMIL